MHKTTKASRINLPHTVCKWLEILSGVILITIVIKIHQLTKKSGTNLAPALILAMACPKYLYK